MLVWRCAEIAPKRLAGDERRERIASRYPACPLLASDVEANLIRLGGVDPGKADARFTDLGRVAVKNERRT